MFYIEKIKRPDKGCLKIKNYKESSAFFVDFLMAIDNKSMASLYVQIKELRVDIDFGFDFLSIYDFLYRSMQYVNSHLISESNILLLYERGDSRVEFKNIEERRTEINLKINPTAKLDYVLVNQVFTVSELNNNILNLVNDIMTIGSCFDLSNTNRAHLLEWEKQLLNSIKM